MSTEKVIVWRDQMRIDLQVNGAKRIIPFLQAMIDAGKEIDVSISTEEIKSAAGKPEIFAKRKFEQMLPEDELVGPFKKKRSAMIEDLELPDMGKFIRAASRFAQESKGVPIPFMKIEDGAAIINEKYLTETTDNCTIYATTEEQQETWSEMTQLVNAINRFNAFANSAHGIARAITPETLRNYTELRDGKNVPNIGGYLGLAQRPRRK